MDLISTIIITGLLILAIVYGFQFLDDDEPIRELIFILLFFGAFGVILII